MASLDDYATRPGGAHNCWVARIVAAPFCVEHGREFHGGQLAASAGHHMRADAVAAAFVLIHEHPSEWHRGARVIVEPGFYSHQSIPRAERLVWGQYGGAGADPSPDDLVGTAYVEAVRRATRANPGRW